MKKVIKLQDYLSHLDASVKQAIDAELSTSEILPEDMIIKRMSSDEMIEMEDEEYMSSGYASTRMLDLSMDMVPPEAWQLDIFKKNPVIFYNHNQSSLPIGKATKTRLDDKGLKVTIKYAINENPEAQTIYKLVKGGYIKQHSVGFIPLKSVKKGDKGFDEVNKSMREKYTDYNGRAERIITKALLLEISIVNIADNQSCTIDSIKDFSAEDMIICKRLGINQSIEEPKLVIKRFVKPIIKMSLVKSIDELKLERAMTKALELAKLGKIIRLKQLDSIL